MNLYLTRDGQTFGPYTVEQAREYLIAGQFLEQDFALFEGQTEWQSLGQLLASVELPQPVEAEPLAETLSATGQSRTPVASSGEGAQSSATGQEAAVMSSSSSKQTSGGRKTRKITRMNKGGTVVVPKQRSALSKIVSTCIVFLVTLVVVGGLVAILFFVWPGPATMGPILAKMGIPFRNNLLLRILSRIPGLWPKTIQPSLGKLCSKRSIFKDCVFPVSGSCRLRGTKACRSFLRLIRKWPCRMMIFPLLIRWLTMLFPLT